MNNAAYIEFLQSSARRMDLLGENQFRVRAFQRAVRALEGFGDSIAKHIDDGTITEIDGVGKGIEAELVSFREHGTSEEYERLKMALPQDIEDLFRVRGLGPKRIRTLWKELGIGSLKELKDAAESGQIATLPGIGKKTVENILKDLERLSALGGRTPIADGIDIAQVILKSLREAPAVQRAEVAGSYRRGKTTLGDLDFVVASTDYSATMETFTAMTNVKEVLSKGDGQATVELINGMTCDLRLVEPEAFGAMLLHFTGSIDHNIALRQRALQRGLRINEHGVFKSDDEDAQPLAFEHERDVYRALDLPWIAPEMREGRGEIVAAENDELPDLPTLEDIQSDLHMHTTYSDGRASVKEMALAAKARGHSYICITDHSQSLHIANGIDQERLLQQIDEIDQVNRELDGIRILKGLEVDILADGSLDMDDETLAKLDWVVGSVHQWTNQPIDEMTERVIRAVRSGYISALGHPTGRLIGIRDGYEIDLAPVFEACAEEGVAVEVNASPKRLDLDSSMVREALKVDGLWFVINTDAHSERGLDLLIHGMKTARRGWLPKSRVLNTLSYDVFAATIRTPGG